MKYSHLPKLTQRYRLLISRLSLIAFVGCLSVQMSSAAFSSLANEKAQGESHAQQLELGRLIERELAGGQSHSYQMALASGQYVKLLVNQRGIDVVVALFAPDGRKVNEVDSPNGTTGPETISAIAEIAGTYRVEVRSLEQIAKIGRYEIDIEALRAATAEDKYRVEAGSVFRDAEELRFGTVEARRKSIEKYQEAAELYRMAGDRGGEAQALNNLGETSYLIGEMQKALEKFKEGLVIRRAIGNREGEAEILNNIGVVYWSLGEMKDALELHSTALSIRRSVGDSRGVAESLHNIGIVYSSLGDTQKALEKYNESLPLKRAGGDRRGEAITLSSIGLIYWALGDTQKALEMYNESLPIRRAVGDRSGEAITLNNIGLAYFSLGEMQKAMEKYNEALVITRDIGNRSGEILILNGIGTVYLSLGEKQKALEKYNEALPISRAIGDRSTEAGTLCNMGMSYSLLGEKQIALDMLNEALPLSRAVGNRKLEADILYNIAHILNSLGKPEKALAIYNDALLICRAVGDRAGEAYLLFGIARAEQNRGNLTQARQYSEESINLIESLRANIGAQELRASYLASRQEFYHSYIDVLMQLHEQNPAAAFDAEAFAINERARARSLLELLTEVSADIRQGADSSLLDRERSLRQRLKTKADVQTSLLSGDHTSSQAQETAGEIASITAEYEELEAQIRASSPRYAALTQPRPLNLSEIQRQILDPETLLLEYSLGDKASYLFVVSNTSIKSYQLPKRAEIESATRRVREYLTSPQPIRGGTIAKRQAQIKDGRYGNWLHAADLSQKLLGPALSQLGKKRLLIVADGALQYLPFGILPVPTPHVASSRGRPNSTPLIVEHEIVHLPSASTLAILRRELAGRQPAPKAVAVLADPVFSADDARVKPATSGHNVLAIDKVPSKLTRALNDTRGELSRLLMTRDEAKAILSLAPQSDRLEALDFRASRTTSTSWELSQYRVVHFATHGLLNSAHPQLSGLVLSLVDEHGQPQDGFLQLHEIYNLRLPAELVVLSACQTGLGKEIKGEGLVGLTRGFMYAGAARVAASLWKVDDAATAELMKLFYQRMLRDSMRPAAALRAAQVEMRKRPQWESPYYWGAFVLQGEWK
jgi:CHAT domain-containing protein/tetratricopeptide (TPR) repeat protein